MPVVLVAASTQPVPDGYNRPTNYPWVGNLATGDQLVVAWTQTQHGLPSTHANFDILLTDFAGPSSINIANPVWGTGAGSATVTIPHDSGWGIGLEIGGINAGDGDGTVFGFQLSAVYSTPGFNPADAALTLQLGNTLAPFGWSVASKFTGWTGSGPLQLELGVTAIAWTFTTIPPNAPQSAGTPTYFYSAGFATPISPYGAERSTRISFSPQLMRLPSACREVDMFVSPGYVLDIQQLVPSSGR